ncbi:MAG: TIGR01777 family oxidoreductase [Nocardioides sp.]|jgi:uncharacterized protein (TIGR01777 family)
MHFVIAGASGFLGTRLTEHLTGQGHSVTRLVRRQARSDAESQWDPYAGEIDDALIAASDVVVNLAGAPLIGNVHSKKWAHEVRTSRVSTTRLLALSVARAARTSTKSPAFLAGSGVAWYGHGERQVTERSDSEGDALLTFVSREWESAADPARAAGARVIHLRTSPVLDKDSSPLKQLRLLFWAGLGGRLGNGQQRFPVISLRDWLAAVAFLATHDEVTGPVNLCLPEVPTNAEFTAALARAVRRPALVPVPALALKLAAGHLSPELLGSIDATPEALLNAGFEFADPDIESVLRTALR